MSSNENSGNEGGSAPPKVAWATKVGYIGTGVLIGLIAYPFVRKALSKIQPKMDTLFDDLTGKAEDYAEKASDLLAKAKQRLKTGNGSHSENEHEGPAGQS